MLIFLAVAWNKHRGNVKIIGVQGNPKEKPVRSCKRIDVLNEFPHVQPVLNWNGLDCSILVETVQSAK